MLCRGIKSFPVFRSIVISDSTSKELLLIYNGCTSRFSLCCADESDSVSRVLQVPVGEENIRILKRKDW